jgi:hypothetical protein
MATWKKLIVSGSVAELASVSASVGILVGTNQQIQPTQADTRLTGSFTGSFTGDGSGLTGVTATATFPTVSLADLTHNTTKFFTSNGSGNTYTTYGELLTDLAGTNLSVESSDSLTLASTITGLTSVSSTAFSGSFSGSFQGDGSNLTGIAATLGVSGSNGSNGTVDLKTQSLTITGTANEIETSFAGQTLTVGLPNDVTISNNLTVSGDLFVNGTTTNLNVANLNIEDQFALLASGSATGLDAGIIASSGSFATGSALYHDMGVERWAVAKTVAANANSVTPLEYVTTVKIDAGTPSTQEYGKGEMYINTNDDSIWIYS